MTIPIYISIMHTTIYVFLRIVITVLRAMLRRMLYIEDMVPAG